MKNIISLVLVLAIHFTLAAQQNYQIKGIVKGDGRKYKYVHLFDNTYHTIGKEKILNNIFAFEGSYSPKQRFGEIPFAILYVSDQDTIIDKKLLGRGMDNTRMIIMEPDIKIIYDTDKEIVTIKGGLQNDMQNKFAKNDENYKRKIDSAFSAIDLLDTSTTAKSRARYLIKEKLTHQKDISEVELIELNPDSEVALFHFSRFAIVPIVWLERTKTIYNSFSARIKKTEFYEHLKQDIDAQADWESVKLVSKLKIGDQMPVFKLKDLKGDSVVSKNSYGKYTLIDFWASWCVPCKQEIPYIKSAFEKFNNKGFKVIAVSTDFEKDINQWLAAIDTNGSQKFTNLLNSFDKPGIVKDLGISMIPANYLIDDQGKILAINLRGNDLNNKLQELYSRK